MEKRERYLQPGTVLAGKYRIEEGIGNGGFSLTYRATDMDLERTVAIKEFFPRGLVDRDQERKTVVPISEGEDEDFFKQEKAKFINEARRLAKFDNVPGVVSVFNYFQENGTAYLVMDYIDGQTLAQYLTENGKPLSVAETLELLKPVVYALQKIHEADVIHRDISPDNIMIRRSDRKIFLIDFGTTRNANAGSEMGLSVYYRGDGYTPLEQFRRNGSQGPWTDVYSFCATVYKCITGICPVDVQGRLEEDTLVAPSKMGVAIAAEVEAALLDGLAILQKDRIQDMKELQRRLYNPGVTLPGPVEVAEEAAATMPVTVPAKPEPKPLPQAKKPLPKEETLKTASKESSKGRRWLALLGLIACIAGILLAYDVSEDVDTYAPVRRDFSDTTNYWFTYYDGSQTHICWFHENGTLYYVGIYQGKVTNADTLVKTVTVNNDGTCYVNYTPVSDNYYEYQYNYTLTWRDPYAKYSYVRNKYKGQIPCLSIDDKLISRSYFENDSRVQIWWYGDNSDLPTAMAKYNADTNVTAYYSYYEGTKQKEIYAKYVGKFKYDTDDNGNYRVIYWSEFDKEGNETVRAFLNDDGYFIRYEVNDKGKWVEVFREERQRATD